MKRFSSHSLFSSNMIVFTEDDAPKWLCEGGREGSTMCNRWFWNVCVLTLEVGEHIDTDFNRITRLE